MDHYKTQGDTIIERPWAWAGQNVNNQDEVHFQPGSRTKRRKSSVCVWKAFERHLKDI